MFDLHLNSNHSIQKSCIQIPTNFAIQSQHIILKFFFVHEEAFMNYFFAITKTRLSIDNSCFLFPCHLKKSHQKINYLILQLYRHIILLCFSDSKIILRCKDFIAIQDFK